MASDIETYLKELQAALASAGADPALAQDALFDAEEYLQAAMAVGGKVGRGTATYETRLIAAVQGYGTPEEVAAAYVGVPVSAAPGLVPAAVAPAVTVAEPSFEMAPVMTAAAPPSTAPQVEPELQAAPTVEADAAAGVSDAASRGAAVAAAPIPHFCRKCGLELHPGASFCVGCGTVVEAPPAMDPARAADTTAVREAPVAPLAAAAAAGMPAGTVTPPPYAAGAAAAAAPAAAPGALRQIFGVFADPAVWKALVYMLISLGTGIVYFTIVVTGISMSAGMIVLIVGIPLLLLVLGLVRAMSLFEGRLVEVLLGTRMPRRPRSTPPDMGFFQRIGFWLSDGRTWASMVYMVLMLPLGIAYFTIAVTGLSVGVSLITSPIWAWFGDHTFIINGVVHNWWDYNWFPAWGIPIAMITGVVVLIAMFHVIKWIGRGHATFAKAMLVRLPS